MCTSNHTDGLEITAFLSAISDEQDTWEEKSLQFKNYVHSLLKDETKSNNFICKVNDNL